MRTRLLNFEVRMPTESPVSSFEFEKVWRALSARLVVTRLSRQAAAGLPQAHSIRITAENPG